MQQEKSVPSEKYNTKKGATWKKCNTGKGATWKVKHERSVTWKECKMKQHERSETRKKCYIEKGQHKESARWKEWNAKKKYHENSAVVWYERSRKRKKITTWN